jgi:glycosyltransferase involved in cell wall biosynthesis
MKILFFINCLAAGGKERRLIELMKTLKLRQDIEFELALMSNEIHYQEVFDLDIKIHYLIRTTKKDLSVFHKIYKICKNYKPDIVHCWDSMSAVYVLPALKLINIKFVNGMVTDAPEKQNILNKDWLRAKITFPFSNVIIGNSQAGLSAYNAPRTKSICIVNGFDFKRLKTLIPDDKIRKDIGIKTKFVVGMVATFSKYKDYATYFTAAQILLKKRKDITFLALGKYTNSEEAKDLIEKQYLEHFLLLGRSSEVESFINSMDVCVLATFTEGISNSILEYMALGKPVIATWGGGTNEIVEDQKTGFLVSPINPTELSEKIELLLNDEELRMRMGKAGKLRVHNNFSIDKMVDEFVINYQRIIVH